MTGTNPSKPITTLIDEALDRIRMEPLIGILDTETARLALKNELFDLSLQIFATAKDAALDGLGVALEKLDRVRKGT